MKALLILSLVLTACGTASSGDDKISGTNSAQGSSITFEKTVPPANPLPDMEGYTVQTESQESCLYWNTVTKCESRFTPQMNCESALVMLRIADGQTVYWVEQSTSLTAGEYLILRFDQVPQGKLNSFYSVQSQTAVKCLD